MIIGPMNFSCLGRELAKKVKKAVPKAQLDLSLISLVLLIAP